MMRSSAWEKSWIFSPVSLSYTMVPTGTLRTTLSPSRPVQLEPSPWRPRSASYSGLKRKWTSVLWRSLDSMTTSPPRPPSPPEGPPRGTNFSRRKAMQPLPPSPALMRMMAWSMNIPRFDCTVHQRDAAANKAPHETRAFALLFALRLTRGFVNGLGHAERRFLVLEDRYFAQVACVPPS